MSDGVNWNGALPPASPPIPPPRRPSPTRYLWALAILLVLGIALYPISKIFEFHANGTMKNPNWQSKNF